MEKIAKKCLVTGLFLFCFSWINLAGAEFKNGSWCCAKNCTPGKKAPSKFMNIYPDSATNESYCKQVVKSYCGGEGYVCSCSWVNPDRPNICMDIQR
ncbi:hypothetical protein A3F66_04875 [candidate division TM6 bacterium RIFCSPHIGHO2_12_FULL_32_22]|nr:MAG: hypothetical protein A3F66_04875 [candidate division TM6 bacterium RIFCSPHIGHO2_12_FULL_32_22]